MVRLTSLGPMNKVNLVSRRDIQTKILQVLLCSTKREVMDVNFLNLLAIIMERSFLGSDVMGVEIRITK